jgi:hypothetical protein
MDAGAISCPMSLRRLLLLPLLTAALVAQEGITTFTGPTADAEAARLHQRAVDYVTNVVEGKYSYAYIQFHWKRAGANLDRIAQAYPESPTARQLANGSLNLGQFPPAYFKSRVLPRLEEKKVAAFDAVNCAIFLYGLENNTDEAGKKALLQSIVETLCRQIRWSEALGFPVLDSDRLWLWNLVVRQAAIYRNDKLVGELIANTKNDREAYRLLLATQAEGLAFRGEKTEALDTFLKSYPDHAAALRIAMLQGLVRRQKHIDRTLAEKRSLKGLYDGLDGIQAPDQPAASLPDFYRSFGAQPSADARAAYARYFAFLGQLDRAAELAPESAWALDALDFHIHQERFAEASALARRHGLTADLAFLLARAGRVEDVANLLRAQGNPPALVFAAFRGRLYSTVNRLEARENTFADAGLTDPNLTGRLICEWSLTPNRALRGATPWDAVVFKFAPGFDNLPEPKDKSKIAASAR